MSPALLSGSRKKRALPPHGYEGRRATPSFRAPVLPDPPAIALPSDAELARQGFSFEQVGLHTTGPVRLRLKGRPLGVFITREAAGSTIKHHSS